MALYFPGTGKEFIETLSSVDTEILIPVHYVSIGVLSRNWNFPYSDRYFLNSSSKYNHKLAQASLGLAVSADRDQSFCFAEQYRGVDSFFEKTGFINASYYLYDVKPTKNTVACAIASKKIEDFSIVAVTVCGNGYGEEWIGNLNVGLGNRHLGFSLGAELVKTNIRNYIKKNNIVGKLKLWCGAYSRGAAVLNLVVFDLMKEGLFDDSFAYLYASPLATKEQSEVKGLFNIVRENDPFSMLPTENLGYVRCGTTLFLTSNKDNLNRELVSRQKEVADKLGCRNFKENPILVQDFKILYSYLEIIFPTTESYNNIFPLIESLYNNCSLKNLLLNYRSFKTVKKQFNSAQKKAYRKLIKFLLERIVFFRNYVNKQVAIGVWDFESRLDTNIFKEHSGDMYIIGMFAGNEERTY